ncbi:MAG: toxin-antitoxin system HicB family antitoxin [Desulfobacterium sp.]|nr:toxin-antitoxin system HicB family antitoxin [Desulfobacterium sp.]
MNNIIKYKGYTGTVNFSQEDRLFHGKVLGIPDIIGFEGVSVDQLEKDFRSAVDDYLETCREIGKEPEKPFSGKFVLRVDSDLHCSIVLDAKRKNKSINNWVIDACKSQLK